MKLLSLVAGIVLLATEAMSSPELPPTQPIMWDTEDSPGDSVPQEASAASPVGADNGFQWTEAENFPYASSLMLNWFLYFVYKSKLILPKSPYEQIEGRHG
jgi:hypothetical protein